MTKDDIKKKILEDPDFIKNPRFSNSLNKFMSRNSEELKVSAIAKLLMLTEEEVEDIYNKAVQILKQKVKE